MKTFRCMFSAARNVVPPNYYNTDRFGGTIDVSAENEDSARHAAIDALYEKFAAEKIGHVLIKRVEGV